MQTLEVGEGSPLAIIGGGITGVKDWAGIASRLAAGHHRVIRAQQIAVQYGLEDRPLPSSYSIKTEGDAFGQALDHAGITGPVDIVGHSSGALNALQFALDHPDRVHTLTLSEPPAYFLLDEQQKTLPMVVEWASVLRKCSSGAGEPEVDLFLHALGVVKPGMPAKEHPVWPAFVAHRRSMRAFPAILEQHEDSRRLDEFRRPVLLVRGANTVAIHVMFNDAVKKHFPSAAVLTFPGGHNAVVAAGDKFADELQKFLATVH
ncbi:MAG: hypothetical protein NVSMB1_00270 [Polyangiales bacterium]